MSVHVLAAGPLTSVQGAARAACRHLGVGASGAVDPWSHALANVLVGNPPQAASLEITLSGPVLRFDQPARIALCGGGLDASVDGQAIPRARPIDLPAGSVLQLGACRRGVRGYLAVQGGLGMPCVLGSVSTDLRGGFGGMRGRALARGDVLPLAQPAACTPDALCIAPWWVDEAADDHAFPEIRSLAGADTTASGDALFATPWKVDAASDRQGLRLRGPALAPACAKEAISEPVFPGTVQLPPDGQPIVLLADAQTHGGYPRVGHAVRADWPKLAQLRPGDTLTFVPVTQVHARQAWHLQQQRFARIALAIAARTGRGMSTV